MVCCFSSSDSIQPPPQAIPLKMGVNLGSSSTFTLANTLSLIARRGLRWLGNEVTQGTITWDTFDTCINNAEAAGVRILATMVSAPIWAAPSPLAYPAGHEQDYFNFCSRVAAR